ncbi:MAG: NAD(P)H-hydrate dehydratase, partial [Thermomicrobiales bacterium]
ADGLNWLADQSEWWTKFRPMSMILTPHPGEMARLTNASGEEIVAEPQKHAMAAAKLWKQVVLLKGSRAVLTDGASVFIGESIPPSLASAGTGDVLAGTIGAFLAQGLSLLDAGCLAIYVGTEAARAVERDYGTLGLIASDLPDAIGRELAVLERNRAT